MASGGEPTSSSSSRQGVGDDGEVPQSVDPDRQAKILAFVQKRREMWGQAATSFAVPPTVFTEKDVDNLYKRMVCQGEDCGRIPPPSCRYGCLRGHHYCFDCFQTRELVTSEQNGEVITCGRPMVKHKLDEVGYSHGMLPPSAVNWSPEEKKKVDIEITSGKCLLGLRKLDADPLYTQLFGNTRWRCSSLEKMMEGLEVECADDLDDKQEGISGWDIDKLMKKCVEERAGSLDENLGGEEGEKKRHRQNLWILAQARN